MLMKNQCHARQYTWISELDLTEKALETICIGFDSRLRIPFTYLPITIAAHDVMTHWAGLDPVLWIYCWQFQMVVWDRWVDACL